MSAAPSPLALFLRGLGALVDRGAAEAELLQAGRGLLADLIADGEWLPAAYARPAAERYRQYLLYRDPTGRFSVVSFVWGPGQTTPVHDHTVWGLVGVLRGAELSQRFSASGEGPPEPLGPPDRLEAGAVEAVSPTIGDVHKVSNAFDDRVSVSIHVYGADIGVTPRWVYPDAGGRKAFVSGYDNDEDTPPFELQPVERAA